LQVQVKSIHDGIARCWRLHEYDIDFVQFGSQYSDGDEHGISFVVVVQSRDFGSTSPAARELPYLHGCFGVYRQS
jgi:hypothetical protein